MPHIHSRRPEGFVVNAEVADAQNWVWKVHAVEQGWADDCFLEMLSTERRAVASDNAKQSKINEERTFRLVAVVMKPGHTAARRLLS